MAHCLAFLLFMAVGDIVERLSGRLIASPTKMHGVREEQASSLPYVGENKVAGNTEYLRTNPYFSSFESTVSMYFFGEIPVSALKAREK